MHGLEDILDHLGDEPDDDGSRPAFVAAIERALAALTGYFDGMAVVRDGRLQLILQRAPHGNLLLVAGTATAADHAVLREKMARDDHTLAIVGELLGLTLGIPRGRLRTLPDRARRIVELGERLAAH